MPPLRLAMRLNCLRLTNLLGVQLLFALKFAGGLLMFLGLTLFVVRWNKINGKAGGLGLFIAAGNTGYMCFQRDGGIFVPRGWYIFVAMFILGGLVRKLSLLRSVCITIRLSNSTCVSTPIQC